MRKLTLEALVVWLALAAVPGQALAAMQTGARNDLLSMLVSRGNGASNTGDSGIAAPPLVSDGAGLPSDPSIEVAWPSRYFTEADALRLSVASGVSLPGTDDGFTLGGKNGQGADLKRGAIFTQHGAVVGVLHVLAPANSGNGPVKAVQTVRSEGSGAAKFNLAAETRRPSGKADVPEPGSWATVLAGLLGVIAIARRRMSS